MNGIATKALFFLANTGLVFVLAIDGKPVQSAPLQPAASGVGKTAEQVFKNIESLKGMPADQVNPVMQFIAGSLGVNCGHCHEAGRHLDTKPQKQVARKMIQMVDEINQNFGGARVVNCYTCHRGSASPEMPTVSNLNYSSSPASAIGDETSTPTADQLLDKYLTALGGTAAIQRISTLVERGTITEYDPNRPPQSHPIEIFTKAPAKRFAVTHLENADTIAVYNGDAGWLVFSNGRLFGAGGRIYTPPGTSDQRREMTPAEVDAARLEDSLYFAGHVNQLVTELRVQGTEKVDDREVYVVSGRTQRLPLVRLYFDKESGLLARLIHYTETPFGRIPMQIDYSEYRTVDGVKLPSRWSASDFRKRRFAYQMEQVEQNISVEESKFGRPSGLPTLR